MAIGETQSLTYADGEETDPIWGRLVPTSKSYQVLELLHNEIKFGRDKQQVDHEISEPQISSIHCIVRRVTDDKNAVYCQVTDCSTNGTFVNTNKIGKGCQCNMFDGDELVFIQASKKDSKTGKKREKVSFYFYMVKSQELESGISKKYELRTTLGTGSFAVVKLGIDRHTGEHVAIKQINKKKYELKSKNKKPDAIKNECQILQEVNHKNIIKVHDVFETDETLYLVLEMASGGDLFQRIINHKKLSEDTSRKVMWQLLSAIKYLHDRKIAHRDLKPENVLLKDNNSWEIKITDFGLSRALKLDQEALTTMCGTPLFLAPEILSSHKNGGYSFEVDYWSMGVIMYLMLVGHPPYNEKEGHLLDLVKKGKFTFPAQTWKSVSPQAKDLVQNLMQSDPTTRYGWEQVYSHPWMRADPTSIPPPEEFGLTATQPLSTPQNSEPINLGTQIGLLSSGLTMIFDHMDMKSDTQITQTTEATQTTQTQTQETQITQITQSTQSTQPTQTEQSARKTRIGTFNNQLPEIPERQSRKRVWNQRDDFEMFDFNNVDDERVRSPKSKKPRYNETNNLAIGEFTMLPTASNAVEQLTPLDSIAQKSDADLIAHVSMSHEKTF